MQVAFDSDEMVYYRRIVCTRCMDYKQRSPTKSLGLCEDCWVVTGQREIDKRSQKWRLPFHFFRLPLEIRRMIYELLFASSGPTFAGTTYRKYCPQNLEYSCQCLDWDAPGTALAFLRTCQQAYEEATECMYGANVYLFEDMQHGEYRIRTKGYEEHCTYCMGDDPLNPCYDRWDDTHWVTVPVNDLVYMHGKCSDLSYDHGNLALLLILTESLRLACANWREKPPEDSAH